MGYAKQVLCTVISCYLMLLNGLLQSWPSTTINIFQSANTTLHRPMGETELALFGATSSIGGLVSTPVVGYFLDHVGRKNCLMFATITQVIAWAIIAVIDQVEVILTAVFIAGMGGCSFLLSPLFVSEICQESIRGAMTSMAVIFYAIGLLVAYIIGGMMSYHGVVYVSLMLSIVGVVMVTYIRETPVYLMKKGLDMEAQKSFAFYRNAKVDSKEVLQEMATLRRAFNPDMDEETPEEEKLKTGPEKASENLSYWKFIKKSRSTRRAMMLTTTVLTLALFQGLVPVQVYAEPLFLEAVPNMSPTVASVVMAVITIVVGLIGAYLTDIAGRRPLLICSSISSGLCCIILGTQLHIHWAPHWVTALGIYLFTVTYMIGAGTVPYVLIPEIFLPEVKSFMAMFIIEWGWVCNFLILFVFNPLVNAVGLGPVFYLFSAVCFTSATFAVLFLPETKGLSVDVKSFMAMFIIEWGWVCNFLILFVFNPLVNAVGLGPVFYLFSAVCFTSATFAVLFLPETKGLSVDVIQTLLVKKSRL